MSSENNNKRLADFLYEIGMLAHTPRSGFPFLGSGKQNVAEHTLRVAYIALGLAYSAQFVNTEKILLMAMFHDASETRISDLNHVHQKYVTRNEALADSDQLSGLLFGPWVSRLLVEYHERESHEARLVKDADDIELLLKLKENDKGNPQISHWMEHILPRLKTKQGQELAQAILESNSWDWWKKLIYLWAD